MGNKDFSRRGFLKTAAAVGAALTVRPAIDKVKAANAVLDGENAWSMKQGGLPHRTLGTGRAAFEVSALGFGVMGMTYNRSQHPDKKQCIRLLHEAVERGVTLFDTAIIYGPLTNELLAGEALAEFRGKINVTTKFEHEVIDGKGTGRQDSSRKTVRRYCEDSLRRLRLETLPMFYQHRADPNTPAEEVAQTIAELMKEGKVQHWGMCEVAADTIRRAHAVCPLTAVQSEYHLMHREVETNGLLTRCYTADSAFDPATDYRASMPQFRTESFGRNRALFALVDRLAEEYRATPSQIALAWMMNKKPWIVPIPGTRRLCRLKENAGAADIRMSDEAVRAMDRALDAMTMSEVFGGSPVVG